MKIVYHGSTPQFWNLAHYFRAPSGYVIHLRGCAVNKLRIHEVPKNNPYLISFPSSSVLYPLM